MKTLSLLRHAKSAWDDSSLIDAERPLARRGREAATAIGRHLRQRGDWPALVLCSPAQRAAETLALVLAQRDGAGGGEAEPVVTVRQDLYLNGWPALLDVVHGLPDAVERVLLVGHNPDLQDLACRLVGSGPAEPRRGLAAKFPTGGLAVIEFDHPEWGEVAAGGGRLRAFVRPRDLT